MPARSKGSSSAPTNSPKKSVPNSKQKKAVARDTDDESENEYNSDALDDSDDEAKNPKKRKRKTETTKKIRSPKKKKTADTDEEEFELEDGQEIVGVVVKAPTTGLGASTEPPSAINFTDFA